MSQAFVSSVGASFLTTAQHSSLCQIRQRNAFLGSAISSTRFGNIRHMQPTSPSWTRHKRDGSSSKTTTGPPTMLTSNDFRTGTTIEMDGVPYRVLEFLHVKPGKGSAFVRTKLKNMRTGNNVDKTFRAGETVAQAQLEKSTMQHTYVDGDDFVFMNVESFEEERMTADTMGDDVVKFLKIGQDVEVLKHNENVIGVELPKTLTFEVMQTEPGAKGNTASGNVLKPAIIETGTEVMVPIFINNGEQIRVSTEDGKYLGRSND